MLIPFVIAILGVVTISRTYNLVDADIVAIEWDYSDVEGFQLIDGGSYALYARGVNQRGQTAQNNTLVWEVHNKDGEEAPHAEIIYNRDRAMLKVLSVGEVTITCHNENGNIFKTMTGVIYKEGAVLISSLIKTSGNNIDPIIYYGDTDLENGNKVDAKFALSIKTLPEDMIEHIRVIEEETTNNFTFDLDKQMIYLTRGDSTGLAKLTLGFNGDSGIISSTFSFKIVDEGINIYSYEDLLYVSTNASVGVLRKSFESMENAFVFDKDGKVVMENGAPKTKDNNVTCFGNFNAKEQTVKFSKSDLYHFTTTYNHEFIDQWNEKMRSFGSSNFIDDQIYVGLRIQNDLYGNGYTINFHNLTYPSGGSEIILDDGSTIFVPENAKDDIFQGPLPFYTLGDHNNMPLVEALGQDNIGLYLDASNIVLNDVYVKNCDFGNFFDILNNVGTVVDCHGDNIKITNCRLSSGKNVVRSFSNMNLEIDNCLLSYAKCFLIFIGSNEYKKNNVKQSHPFVDASGNDVRSTLEEYLSKGGQGDILLNDFLMSNYSNKATMKRALTLIDDALNNGDNVPNEIKSQMKVKDTYFYYSAVASIGSEILFNGPYLFNALPSQISELLGMLSTAEGYSLYDLLATNVGGLSYPTKVELVGNCKFFNFQTIDKNHNSVDGVDISGLIKENITAMAATLGEQYAVDVNIEKFFPIKDYLYDAAGRNGEIYTKENTRYINIVAAWYGGGINKSIIDFSGLNDDVYSKIGNPREINLLDTYLDLPKGSGMVAMYKNMMLKAVTIVTGTYPFKFACVRDGYLYGEKPNVVDLIKNARGA